MRHVAVLIVVLAACGGGDATLPPITGTVHHFVVDGFTFPASTDQAHALAEDLDGDGRLDNQFGSVTSTLAGEADLNANISDIIGAGVIASTVDLIYEDGATDPVAGASIFGFRGAAATQIRGKLVSGAFVSDRPKAGSPGQAVLRLPVLADADPIEAELDDVDLELTPDGAGGYDATVHGGFPADQLLGATLPAVLQMANSNPQAHIGVAQLCTQLSPTGNDVLMSCPLVSSLLEPDVTLSGVSAVSAGFQLHLAPCPSGSCTPAPPHDPCRDRILDGDETALDCGGTTCTLRCTGGLACKTGSDCDTGFCDAGTCRTATCHDGIRDGFETGVDTGGLCS
jgi:hypothetical protein